ncbi:ABC transporter substrate-binding protein [Paenibacillus oceani]|uniref:Extracellular solute-binding protein n=1 Tax=Paenibacillus oceani TaxID=2772510 RepID=A0A927CE15_9BACL|nr:extracellular solute-binding protein [Paenibacillus oceani]MBD2864953.1 extracellular solute-binding protein [Paenibacillus oceani]
MNIKWIKSLSVLTLLTAAACGSKEGAGESAPAADPAKPQTKEPVELVVVTPDADFNEALLEKLGKKFPNYTIRHINQSTKGNSIPELLTNGTPIDLYGKAAGGFAEEYIANKLHYDMTDLVKTYKINPADYEKGLIDYVRKLSDGKMYALPGNGNNLVVFYNKTVFDRFGVAYPKNGMTWSEMMELAKKLTRTEDGKSYIGLSGHTQLLLNWNQMGLPFVDPKTGTPMMNKDERWRTFFQTIYGEPVLTQAYQAAGQTFSQGNSAFYAGTVGMMIFNSNTAAMAGSNLEKMDWDMVAMPSFPGMPNVGTPMNATLWAVPAISRNKEAAMDVIAYLLSDEYMGEMSRRGKLVSKQTDAILKHFGSEATPKDKNWSALIHNKFAPFPEKAPYEPKILTINEKFANEYMAGKADLNTALRMMEEEALKVIQQEKAK